jgi:hypothetical protein
LREVPAIFVSHAAKRQESGSASDKWGNWSHLRWDGRELRDARAAAAREYDNRFSGIQFMIAFESCTGFRDKLRPSIPTV